MSIINSKKLIMKIKQFCLVICWIIMARFKCTKWSKKIRNKICYGFCFCFLQVQYFNSVTIFYIVCYLPTTLYLWCNSFFFCLHCWYFCWGKKDTCSIYKLISIWTILKSYFITIQSIIIYLLFYNHCTMIGRWRK